MTTNNMNDTRNTNLEALKVHSIQVYPGMMAVWPQYGQEEFISVLELAPKFNGCYSVNNSTVAFITENEFFVTPYTRRAMTALSGFREAHFYVPFSNWDYPKQEQARWEQLRKEAEVEYVQEFHEDCIAYCEHEEIAGELPEEILEQCFKMPENGLDVKHPYYESTYYPTIRGTCLDSVASTKLGRFCSNNGRVVFVYRDGSTYVAKGYKIIDYLRAAGYQKAGLFVPFSNGEEIRDGYYRSKWEKLKKVA